MAAPSLDTEFMQLWAKLTVVQKQSLLSVIKSFTEEYDQKSVIDYNKEIDEAISRVEDGDFYTQDEIDKQSKDW